MIRFLYNKLAKRKESRKKKQKERKKNASMRSLLERRRIEAL